LSYEAPAVPYVEAVERPPRLRAAFSADLGGITPVDPEIVRICRAAAEKLSELGCELVLDACPDLSDAVEVFRVLRAEQFVTARAPLLERHRELLKPEVIWNIETGMKLTAEEIGRAERRRGQMQASAAAFFERFDLLLCPAAIVPPFPVEQRYLEELGGHRFPSYIDWVAITYAITLTGLPALSLPCGFTGTGLPVGLQMVGRPRGEAELLAAAARLEDLPGIPGLLPIDPRPGGS
jgi:amidase